MDVKTGEMVNTLQKSDLRPYGLFQLLGRAIIFRGVIHIPKNALLVFGKETCPPCLRVRIPSKRRDLRMNGKIDVGYTGDRPFIAGTCQDPIKFTQHALDAGFIILASLYPPQVLADFRPDRLARFTGDRAVMERLCHLLERKSNKHADNDNADLAGKGAPAVQRLGKVEMHAAALSGYVDVTEGPDGRNGWKKDRHKPARLT